MRNSGNSGIRKVPCLQLVCVCDWVFKGGGGGGSDSLSARPTLHSLFSTLHSLYIIVQCNDNGICDETARGSYKMYLGSVSL